MANLSSKMRLEGAKIKGFFYLFILGIKMAVV